MRPRAQIIYLIGWSPDASQPKPLRRGSASKHLRDLDAELAAMPDAPAVAAAASSSSTEQTQAPLEQPVAAAVIATAARAETKEARR